MKKLVVMIVMALSVAAAGFCGPAVADGLYFAQAADYAKSGWKTQIVVEYKANKIASIKWNGTNNLGLPDKDSYSRSGAYGMENTAKQGAWHDQAGRIIAFILAKQDIKALTVKADNTTDVVSGASIKVNEIVALFNAAVAAPAVKKGPYKKDGWFFASAADFDAKTGWKDTVLVTVVNGSVVDVVWNGVNKDTKKKSKLLESLAGTYGMEKDAKQGPWHQQAAKVQEFVVKNQTLDKVVLKDGKTDAISGATLYLGGVFGLINQALAAAR